MLLIERSEQGYLNIVEFVRDVFRRRIQQPENRDWDGKKAKYLMKELARPLKS